MRSLLPCFFLLSILFSIVAGGFFSLEEEQDEEKKDFDIHLKQSILTPVPQIEKVTIKPHSATIRFRKASSLSSQQKKLRKSSNDDSKMANDEKLVKTQSKSRMRGKAINPKSKVVHGIGGNRPSNESLKKTMENKRSSVNKRVHNGTEKKMSKVKKSKKKREKKKRSESITGPCAKSNESNVKRSKFTLGHRSHLGLPVSLKYPVGQQLLGHLSRRPRSEAKAPSMFVLNRRLLINALMQRMVSFVRNAPLDSFVKIDSKAINQAINQRAIEILRRTLAKEDEHEEDDYEEEYEEHDDDEYEEEYEEDDDN